MYPNVALNKANPSQEKKTHNIEVTNMAETRIVSKEISWKVDEFSCKSQNEGTGSANCERMFSTVNTFNFVRHQEKKKNG